MKDINSGKKGRLVFIDKIIDEEKYKETAREENKKSDINPEER